MKKAFSETVAEARFWITIVATIIATQTGAAVFVPGQAEDAARVEAHKLVVSATDDVENNASSAITLAVKELNVHAEAIEEIQAANEDFESEMMEIKREVREVAILIEALRILAERRHGSRTLQRLVDRADDDEPIEVDPTLPLPPKVAKKPTRLPESYKQLVKQQRQTKGQHNESH